MTKQEHQLMFALFTKNLHMMNALITLLQANGTIEQGDLKAYNAISGETGATDSILKTAKRMYLDTARKLGLDIPQETLE